MRATGTAALALGLAAVAATARAQPVRRTPEGTVVTVPVRVDIRHPWSIHLVTEDVVVAEGSQVAAVLPTTVPVRQVDENGVAMEGVTATRPGSYEFPARISLDQVGRYRIETVCVAIPAEFGSYSWVDEIPVEYEYIDPEPVMDYQRYLNRPRRQDRHGNNSINRRGHAAVSGPPEPAEPIAPPDGQQGVCLTPTLQWIPGQSASVSHVFLYEGAVLLDEAKVVDARNLTTSRIAIPAGILKRGKTYMWFVTSEIASGIRYSEQFTFTTDWAPSEDGGATVFDLLNCLDLWFAGDPAADIDGTPGVDVCDLLEYLECWSPSSSGTPCS